MDDKKNLLIFVLIFIGSMAIWDHFVAPVVLKKDPVAVTMTPQNHAPQALDLPTPTSHLPLPRSEMIAAAPRLRFETPKISGSINLQGGQIDDLTLLEYRTSAEPESDPLTLLSPARTENPYYAEFGWTTPDADIDVPTPSTLWERDPLGPMQSHIAQIRWTNPQGITFIQRYELDTDYMFKVIRTVKNGSDRTLTLSPYGRIVRTGTPTVGGAWMLHEGPIGYIDGLQEFTYKDLQKANDKRFKGQGGWIGITDKYWLAALVPDQSEKQEFFFKDVKMGGQDNYETGCYGTPLSIAPGTTQSATQHFFAGAKVLSVLDKYEESLQVKHFDLAVDFGWFYFITKPFFYFLSFLNQYLGNFGLAILAVTVLLKGLMFPLASKSYRSMARMKALQPKIQQIQQRYSQDKVKLNQETMELYKREKINPLAGCLPMLLQIPIFFALYKVLFVSIEMRHAPFYGWVRDLAAPDSTNIFTLFGLLPWTPPAMLHVGVLPLLMGLTMWAQQSLTPTTQDPAQAKVMKMMPLICVVAMANFPAGLLLYWTWSNLLSMGQQALIGRSGQRAS